MKRAISNPAKIALINITGILFFIGQDIAAMHALGNAPTTRGYLTFLVELGTFYFNLLWVLPVAFEQRSRIVFLFRLSIVVLSYFLARNLVGYNKKAVSSFFEYATVFERLVVSIWRLNYALGLSFLVGFYQMIGKRKAEKYQLELSLSQSETEAARLETTMAQMQLAPHWLYNCLSYIQTYAQAPRLKSAVQLMADMLEYSLLDIKTLKLVSVKDEMKQIRKMFRLQELITGTRLFLNIETHLPPETSHAVPPYALITLADNVLKYGELSYEDEPATIQASVQGDVFHFHTSNVKAGSTATGNGIGLKRVTQLLEHFYSGRYSLIIEETEEAYTLDLKIET